MDCILPAHKLKKATFKSVSCNAAISVVTVCFNRGRNYNSGFGLQPSVEHNVEWQTCFLMMCCSACSVPYIAHTS